MPTTENATMTSAEIARTLKKHCDKGDFEGAQKLLYAKDAVSIEPMASQGFEKETHGLDAILKKGEKWNEMVSEVHGIKVSDPMVAGDSFALSFNMEVTMKDGKKSKMNELGVYHVKEGKIVSEQFFM